MLASLALLALLALRALRALLALLACIVAFALLARIDWFAVLLPEGAAGNRYWRGRAPRRRKEEERKEDDAIAHGNVGPKEGKAREVGIDKKAVIEN